MFGIIWPYVLTICIKMYMCGYSSYKSTATQ